MPRKSRKNVGLIGLGIIGTRVASGLRSAGFHVFVWNRTAKPAPNFVGSPAEVAELCDVIQLFVSDAQALFDVIEQMKEVLTSRHVIVCNATVGPEATMEAARVVEETGAHFLDAPFTGSKSAAEKRSLVYYIGGDEATFLRARPVLEATSKGIVRIGGIGHAATLKVVTNMIAAVSIQTLGEALAIVQKAGLDPEVLAAALEQNACRSGTMDLKLPKMISGDYEAHFSLKHMFKDVQLGIHIANALDIEIPATTVTAGVMYGALNQGWGDLDFSSLYKIYEPQAAGGTSSAELQSGFAQIEDLDAREVHYPETTVPAPPRPGSELPPLEVVETIKPLTDAEAARVEPPSLASALSAPLEIVEGEHKPSEPVAESTPAPEPTPAPAEEPAIALLAPLQYPAAEPAPLPPIDVPKEDPVPAAAVLEPETSLAAPAAEAAPVELPVLETKPVDASAEAVPEPPKIIELSPPGEIVRDISATVVSSPASQNGGSADSTNGHVKDEPETGAKPFNFVKRWFVSRTGG